MSAPKNPLKRKLWIKRLSKAHSGTKNPMYGIYLIGTLNGMWGKEHTEITKQKISKANQGHIPWNKGIPRSKETKEKIRLVHIGKHYSPRTEIKKGQHIGSQTEFKKGDPRISGSNSSFWKGGFSPLPIKIRMSFEYRQWRSDVFTRDDFTCQECNRRGGDLHAHHIKPFALILELNDITTLGQAKKCSELWNINNGITLCERCHNETKKKKD